jgi:hypothetical protein
VLSKPLISVLAVYAALAGSARAAEDDTSAPKPSPTAIKDAPAEAPAANPSPTTSPEARADRPWAKGVPESAQQEALALFDEGNKLFEQSQHAAALAKYREALKVWDHPAIRYNAAVALINLDQPLAARENLELALKYGSAPYSSDTYQQALTYEKLLNGQLATVKVTCDEPGAAVSMDGAPLFVGPGDVTRWILPGPHQLVAHKSGYLTETKSLTLLPGKPASERLVLQELRNLPTKTVRRWPVWKPWAVVGAGALVALVGLPVILDAKSNNNAFDAEVQRICPMGCDSSMIPRTAFDAKDRGRTENIVAVSLFAVGGAVAASGVALVVLNQPRVMPADEGTRLTAAPIIGNGTLGFSLAFQH